MIRDLIRRALGIPPKQLCSICIFLPGFGLRTEADISPAHTTINGQAVCLNHTGYVAGGQHSEALQAATR